MSTSKTVPYSQWPPPALTHAERRRRHWCTCSSCNDGVIQLSQFSSYAMLAMSSSRSVMYVLYTFSCSVLHTLLLTGFKSGEFRGHNIDAEWILAFLFLLAKTACIFQWRHNYVITTVSSIAGTFYNFSVTQKVGMICAKKLWKVV